MKALAWALLTVLFIVTVVHARDLSVDSAKNTRAAMATAKWEMSDYCGATSLGTSRHRRRT